MKKKNHHLYYKDPFDSPTANPKRAFHQVNGETQLTQQDIILRIDTRKQN